MYRMHYFVLVQCVFACVSISCSYCLTFSNSLVLSRGVDGVEGVKVPCLLGRGRGAKHQPL